jgi:hypothetical protein
MKQIISILLLSTFVLLMNPVVFSQEEAIKLADVDFQNSVILFERYIAIGKNCKSDNGNEKYCLKEERLLDNNIEDLLLELENTLTYLENINELISKKDIDKEIYADKSFYRYVISSEPKTSKKGNACFSNPGSLIFKYYILDRLENKKYPVHIDYAFYICDIQILVNDINKNLKKKRKKEKS